MKGRIRIPAPRTQEETLAGFARMGMFVLKTYTYRRMPNGDLVEYEMPAKHHSGVRDPRTGKLTENGKQLIAEAASQKPRRTGRVFNYRTAKG